MPTAITTTAARRILNAATVVVAQVWGAAVPAGSAVSLDVVLAAVPAGRATYWPAQVDGEGRAYPASVTIETGRDELRYTVMIPA